MAKDYQARPVITHTVNCPTCGSRLTGYIGESRYFCRECYIEFKVSKQKIAVYDIHKDGHISKRGAEFNGIGTKYHGISYKQDRKKWNAAITHNGKREHLGSFDTPKQAAIAYNKRAVELMGDNAKLNYIGG